MALLHRFMMHSDELPVVQGPVLRVGLDRLAALHQFGFAVSAQYQYPRRHTERDVALELESLASRIDARYLATGLVEGSAIGLSAKLASETTMIGASTAAISTFAITEIMENTPKW